MNFTDRIDGPFGRQLMISGEKDTISCLVEPRFNWFATNPMMWVWVPWLWKKSFRDYEFPVPAEAIHSWNAGEPWELMIDYLAETYPELADLPALFVGAER